MMKSPDQPVIVLHGFSGNKNGLGVFLRALDNPQAIALDLPGVSDNQSAPLTDWVSFAEAVITEINHAIGPQQFELIGHSQGAMVAFVLAARYPNRVTRVAMMCPTAHGTLLSRCVQRGTLGLSRIIGMRLVLGIYRWRPSVDFVTFVSRSKYWSRSDYERIREMRRDEATTYSSHMIEAMRLIWSFPRECHDYSVMIPVRIVYAPDDLLVTRRDIEWFTRRCKYSSVRQARGGHVGPVALPAEWAEAVNTR